MPWTITRQAKKSESFLAWNQQKLTATTEPSIIRKFLQNVKSNNTSNWDNVRKGIVVLYYQKPEGKGYDFNKMNDIANRPYSYDNAIKNFIKLEQGRAAHRWFREHKLEFLYANVKENSIAKAEQKNIGIVTNIHQAFNCNPDPENGAIKTRITEIKSVTRLNLGHLLTQARRDNDADGIRTFTHILITLDHLFTTQYIARQGSKSFSSDLSNYENNQKNAEIAYTLAEKRRENYYFNAYVEKLQKLTQTRVSRLDTLLNIHHELMMQLREVSTNYGDIIKSHNTTAKYQEYAKIRIVK